MTVVYLLVWGSVVVGGLTAVYGLVWAIRTGQLRDFAGGAVSIFDDEEPVGEGTDGFPDAGGVGAARGRGSPGGGGR